MKLVSWNVNGLRACIQKGFLEQFHRLDADFFCLQETKLQPGQLTLDLPGYQQYWCYAEKKGYSGTAIFTKHTPLSVSYGIGVPELDNEGRVITLEYPEFYLVTCYTPNAQRGLARIEYRMRWDEAFRSYIKELDSRKPAILCGDLNVAHKEIDLKNPSSNRQNAGFSDEERESFTKTLDLGFTDTFRHLHPDTKGAYTWWSYMFHARENNAGWRIDYFLVSDRIKDRVYKTPIYSDILGSDHCPVGLELDIKCNGGIWSPECIDLAPPRAEEITSESKKAAPALKAGAIAILALCLLIGGWLLFDLFPLPGSNEESSALISVYIFDTPLTDGDFDAAMLPYYPLTDGDSTWRTENEDLNFPLDLSYKPINFWIRIDLTELGKQTVNRYDEVLAFSFNPTIISSQMPAFKNLEPSHTQRRYFHEDGTLAGWFLYGFIPSTGTAEFSLILDGAATETSVVSVPIEPYMGRSLSTERIVSEFLISPSLLKLYIQSEGISNFEAVYRVLLSENELLQVLEYRGYEAAQVLYQHFVSNQNGDCRTVAEAFLSLRIYQSQLTVEQALYLNEHRTYYPYFEPTPPVGPA